jgi:hypothetical protein
LNFYNGRGGRIFPLWRNREASESNIIPSLFAHLSLMYKRPVNAEDLLSYIAAVAANSAFTARFKSDLVQPGLRVPVTANSDLFVPAADLGRNIIWLHTFGERFADPKAGRPSGPPRLPPGVAPRVSAGGAIPQTPAAMPDTLDYDEDKQRLLVGTGHIDHVSPGMWNYEVSGKRVLRYWFSYRKANRERPIIGDRRPPSKLGDIQPDHWLPEYTTELINVLNVLGRLIELEPIQAELLERLCSGPMLSAEELRAAGALTVPESRAGLKTKGFPQQSSLLD